MTNTQVPDPADQSTSVLVSITRMEGKLDLNLSKHEDLAEDVRDHEGRIRKIEDRKTISPTGLWTTVLGAIGAIAALVAIYMNIGV